MSRAAALPALPAEGHICKGLHLCQGLPVEGFMALLSALPVPSDASCDALAFVVSIEHGQQHYVWLDLLSPRPRTQQRSRDWAGGWCAQDSCWPSPSCGHLHSFRPPRQLTGGPSGFMETSPDKSYFGAVMLPSSIRRVCEHFL